MNLFLRRNLAWIALVLCLLLGASTDPQADRILGHWLFPTKGSSVTIYRVGQQYFARVTEVDPAGEQNYGLVKETVLIRDLSYDGQGWSGGQLVHPKTGIHLSVEVAMVNSQEITVTVYKGLKLLRRRFNMTRKAA